MTFLTDLDELARLVGWAGCGVGPVDWTDIEGELGVPLPSDYKSHVARFPCGLFQGGMEVLQPCSLLGSRDYLAAVQTYSEDLLHWSSIDSELPFEVYPTIPGLLPWAAIEGDPLLCWYLTGKAEESLPTFLVRVWSGETDRLEGSMARCIKDAITGHVPRLVGSLRTAEAPEFLAYSSTD